MTRLLLSAFSLVLSGVGCASADPRDNVDDDIETPAYTTLRRDGAFEVRRYEPVVVARTVAQGDLDEASRTGFRRLAGYIFGNNIERQEVAMTAPVSTRPARRTGQTIDMTAPVSTTPAADEGWEVTFTMPHKYRLQDLPRPQDDRVQLDARPAQCRAVVVFAGFTGDDTVETQRAALRRWLDQHGVTAAGAPTLARYNQPWTLPWNRRNEVLVPLDEAACGKLL